MQGSIAKTVVLAMTRASGGRRRGAGADQRPPPPASATEDEQRSIFTLQIENDVFNRFSPTDRDYTNGVRIGLAVAGDHRHAGLGWLALTTMPTFFGEGRRRIR